MKTPCFVAVVLACSCVALAQEDTLSLEDLVQQGVEWAQENLDPAVFRALGQLDQDKVQQFFEDVQKQLQGEYVLDLAELQKTAVTVLPLLEAYEETRPYAAWLKTRLDYFAAADELKHTALPPKVEPGQPPRPAPNPTPEAERKVWQKQLDKRPLPKGAEAYAARLKTVFAAQQVPKELVWLAEVESSFDPAARSPVGAAGLFQLMPRTAQSLGLSLRPHDERLQPEKCAAAAAKYLMYLHGQFHDWPLALAAYNVGEGRVRGLLTKYKATSFEKIASHLPAETQMYVPKIDATLQRREGVTLAKLSLPRS